MGIAVAVAVAAHQDYGKTWASSSPPISATSNECSIAFLPPAPAPGVNAAKSASSANGAGNIDGAERIVMNCRTSKHERAQIVWTVNGSTGVPGTRPHTVTYYIILVGRYVIAV